MSMPPLNIVQGFVCFLIGAGIFFGVYQLAYLPLRCRDFCARHHIPSKREFAL